MMDAPIFSDALGRQGVTLLVVRPHPDDESILVNWLIHLSPMIQGHLVFQYNPDEGQSLYRLGSQPTASCRNIRMACPPEQANRGVT